MKLGRKTFRSSSVKAALLALVAASPAAMTIPADAGVTDPLQGVYVFSGVRDDGGAAGAGVSTVVHCTNFSGVTEKVQYVVLNFNAATVANLTLNIPNLGTRTASTHGTNLYTEDLFLNTGVVNQGLLGVSATTLLIHCTAQVVDAAAATPNGIELYPVRFNPIAGTFE